MEVDETDATKEEREQQKAEGCARWCETNADRFPEHKMDECERSECTHCNWCPSANNLQDELKQGELGTARHMEALRPSPSPLPAQTHQREQQQQGKDLSRQDWILDPDLLKGDRNVQVDDENTCEEHSDCPECTPPQCQFPVGCYYTCTGGACVMWCPEWDQPKADNSSNNSSSSIVPSPSPKAWSVQNEAEDPGLDWNPPTAEHHVEWTLPTPEPSPAPEASPMPNWLRDGLENPNLPGPNPWGLEAEKDIAETWSGGSMMRGDKRYYKVVERLGEQQQLTPQACAGCECKVREDCPEPPVGPAGEPPCVYTCPASSGTCELWCPTENPSAHNGTSASPLPSPSTAELSEGMEKLGEKEKEKLPQQSQPQSQPPQQHHEPPLPQLQPQHPTTDGQCATEHDCPDAPSTSEATCLYTCSDGRCVLSCSTMKLAPQKLSDEPQGEQCQEWCEPMAKEFPGAERMRVQCANFKCRGCDFCSFYNKQTDQSSLKPSFVRRKQQEQEETDVEAPTAVADDKQQQEERA